MSKNSVLSLVKYGGIALLFVALGISFQFSHAWLQLCYGLAMFLFGMQCIEEGLHNAAGGMLEDLMRKSTSTPLRGMFFGMGATFVLQSSTLVSLLSIAFLGTGLITLAGGIAIILGTNLGSTSGIWLLALIGKGVSLSKFALPLFVFGLLSTFFKGQIKSLGRVFIGISLIFIGIDTLKLGFDALGSQIDFKSFTTSGMADIAMFTLVGLMLTIVLQSSHATLILTLAALGGGQISVDQAFAIAIGSNVGTSLTTAIVGMLGSSRSGQRLALAHFIFNTVTALLSFVLWVPLSGLVKWLGDVAGMGALLQLALFHTLFNLLGIFAFWKFQERFAVTLKKWLPSPVHETLLDAPKTEGQGIKPRFLQEHMLKACDTGVRAVFWELKHLMGLSLEVLCQMIYVPPKRLYALEDTSPLAFPEGALSLDAKSLYDQKIKSLYIDILDFSAKLQLSDPAMKERLFQMYVVASHIVDMSKEGKTLQKHMHASFSSDNRDLQTAHLKIREHLFFALQQFVRLHYLPPRTDAWLEQSSVLRQHVNGFDTFVQTELLDKLHEQQIDRNALKNLMTDTHHIKRIELNLMEILHLSADQFAESLFLSGDALEGVVPMPN